MEHHDGVLARLYRRAMTAVGRGRVTTVDDSGPVQMAQIDFGPIGADGKSLQIHDKVPMLYAFGYTALPPAKSDVVTSALGGDQNKVVGVASSHQTYRLRSLSIGDCALYDMRAQSFWLKDTGIVATTPELSTSANLKVGSGATGVITDSMGNTAVFRDGICTFIG